MIDNIAIKPVKNRDSNYKHFSMLDCLTSCLPSSAACHSSAFTLHVSPVARNATPGARQYSSVARYPSFGTLPTSPLINSSCLTQ